MNSQDVRKEFGGMKQLVRGVLKRSVPARNSDKWLTLRVLELLGEDIKVEKESGLQVIVWRIPVGSVNSIPNFETIRRVRQEIQNKDGMYLPTKPEVLVARKIKEESVRSYYKGERVLDDYEEMAGLKEELKPVIEKKPDFSHRTPYCLSCGDMINVGDKDYDRLCKLCRAYKKVNGDEKNE